jgi:hypothetical protein
MNEAVRNDLSAHILQALGSLPASRVRREQMHEELLAHLFDLYDEELERLPDEQEAADRAKQRFGQPDALRNELTTAVPWTERLILHLCGKGSIMWRWLWIVGVLGALVGMGFVLPAVAQLRSPAPIMPENRFGIGVLLPFGVVLTLLGVGLIGYSVIQFYRARRYRQNHGNV